MRHSGGVHPFPRPQEWPDDDLVAISGDVGTDIVLAGYASGLFPMPLDAETMGWFSPLRRGVLPSGALRVRRSLRKTAKRYVTTVDAAFDAVLAACADPSRPGAWIDERIAIQYRQLHAAGVAHSVEVWDADGDLVGGLYGVQLRGLFAGESMFHHPARGRDASKTALLRLVRELDVLGVTLLDVQWRTEHLATLGVAEVSRPRYLQLLSQALDVDASSQWPQRVVTGVELVERWSR